MSNDLSDPLYRELSEKEHWKLCEFSEKAEKYGINSTKAIDAYEEFLEAQKRSRDYLTKKNKDTL